MAKIPFVQDLDITYGKSQALSPLVTRVLADNPGPFTYTGTGVFIVGTDEVAIIDPGPITPAHEAALYKALKGKTVTHILLTHHHADHSPMAPTLARKYGCKTYGMSVQSQLSGDSAVQLEAGVDKSFAPDIEITHGHLFHGPDFTLEALHTPGHTSNHICYALHQENTLFSGDHIMGWATSVVIPPDGNMGQYLHSLRLVKSLKFDKIRPTHGAAITDVTPFLNAYIGHRLAREQHVMDAVIDGKSGVMEMVRSIYTDIDQRLYPAAALSALSHLIHLVEQNQVICEDPVPALSSLYGPSP